MSQTRMVFLVLMVLGCCTAHGRTLSWDALTVEADLYNSGRLHVIERHDMVFDGDWNGGERRFRVAGGQDFTLIGLSEIANGVKQPLRRGDLSAVGEYKLFGGDTLRWRARLPSDPPFHDAKRSYEIEYELSAVVAKTTEGYVLNHDFAFPERSGTIGNLSARLLLDAAWESDAGREFTLQRTALPPGQGAILNLSLRYLGPAFPQVLSVADSKSQAISVQRATDLLHPAPELWRYALLVAAVFAALASGFAWYRHDQRVGKFEPLPSDALVDRAWLDKQVFIYAPEVVGAAWDMTTSSNEVSAVLARMTQEGKLDSEVKVSGSWIFQRTVLHLKLRCKRASLQGYEKQLVDALFVGGGDSTDTDQVQKHYSKSGFDPSKLIEPAMQNRLKSLVDASLPIPTFANVLTAVLFAIALLLVAIGLVAEGASVPVTAFVVISLAGILLMGKLAAASYRNSVDGLARARRQVMQFVVIAFVIVAVAMFSIFFSASPWQPIGFTVAFAAIANSIFNGMRSRETAASLRLRKSLAAGRRYFERELQSPTPKLDDAWFPYVLAFGLGPNADRWFKVQGQSRGAHYSSGTSSAGTGTSTATPSWSGGGGTFGGGGASGSWVAAVGGIATSISAPSSSSSGGGSSGGSSSGGGGGGGW